MEPYVLTLLVTLEQEDAIQKLFGRQGWKYEKLDKSKVIEYGMKTVQDGKREPVVNSAPYNAAEDSVGGGGGDNEVDTNSEVAVDIRTVEQEGINVKLEQDSANGNADADNIDDEEVEGDEEEEDDGDEELDIEPKEEQQNRTRSKKCNKTENNMRKTGRGNKRESSVNPNVRMKKARLASVKAVGQDSEDEDNSLIDQDGVKEESGAENESDGEFYRLLETLPEIEHYTKVLTLDKDTLKSESDTCCLPGDVGDDGYTPSLSAYFCSDCGYVFPEPKYYTGHKRSGKCMFPCQVCNELYSFRNFSRYQKHLKIHRSKDVSDLDEPLDSSFVSVKGEVTECNMKRHTCHICQMSYLRASVLRRHMTGHTENTVMCSHCYKVFPNQDLLESHKENDHAKKQLCALCGSAFLTNAHLKQHIQRAHPKFSDTQPLTCTFPGCEKKFVQKQTFKYHLNSHTGVKPVSCTCCSRQFHSLCNKNVHERVCSGKVLYKCDTCEKTFSDRCSQQRHIQSQHGGKLYRCMCGALFKYSTSLAKHRKKQNH